MADISDLYQHYQRVFRENSPTDCVQAALHALAAIKKESPPLEHYTHIARACVTHLVRMCRVKQCDLELLFLQPPDELDPLFCIERSINNWAANVGDMRDTMYWSCPKVLRLIQNMSVMTMSELTIQYIFKDCLLVHMKGVADIMFVASCFPSPYVVELGDLFWAFAKEIILMRIDNSDDLNLFLCGEIMPQTVIVLAPVLYSLDSNMPAIPVDIVIKGSDKGVESSQYSETVIRFFDSGLLFTASAIIRNIRFVLGGNASPLACAFQVRGGNKQKTNAVFDNIHIAGAGVRVSNCNSVETHRLGIDQATVGFYARNVKTVSMFSHEKNGICSEKSYFRDCDTAFYIPSVGSLICDLQLCYNCKQIFHVCVDKKAMITECDFVKCGKLGQVLGAKDAVLFVYNNHFVMKSVVFKAGVELEEAGVMYRSLEPHLLRNTGSAEGGL